MTDKIIQSLKEAACEGLVAQNEPMSKYTTFRIGGAADVFIDICNLESISMVIDVLKNNNIDYYIIGNGSNILVGDKGVRGAVIRIGNGLSNCEVNGNTIIAQSGIKLSRLASVALDNSLAGLEFASGIPGTLGGALFMNAGAYGGEMKDVVKTVTSFDIETGKVFTKDCSECNFGYRKSIFGDGKSLILGAEIELKPGNKDEIRNYMNELSKRRSDKQPVDKPSAGSTFKRPEGYFAGTLIQEAGLKGRKIGGAQVSEKHSGFIINAGNATAKDVLDLIKEVQNIVLQKYNVKLEPEVRLMGEF